MLLNWVVPTLEYDYDFKEEPRMPYVNPKANYLKSSAEEDDEKPKTVEQEIMRMEKFRREMIKKMGGERYHKSLAELIRRKQKRR